MADLFAGAIERIDEARRQTIAKLKRAWSVVPESDKVDPFLPAFMTFAVTLFDAKADEFLGHCKTESDFESERNKLAQRIVDDSLPDRGLATAWANMPDELKRVSTEWEMATGRLSEVQRTKPMSFEGEADRAPLEGGPVWEHVPTQTPARSEACALGQHFGYWERFAPECVRFALRFHQNNAKVREALRGAIQRTVGFWADRLQSQVGAGLRKERTVPQFPKRAEWLKSRLAEREWNEHDLEHHGGPEHRTTKKILAGLNVQDDVLRKVILGLQSKPIHNRRTLRPVAELDIPND
jgi:hypothetical protein